LTGRWYEARKRDVYHRLAKQQGYRSRAAYKLMQLNRSFQIIRAGDVVVDLGAAPGGWMQVACEAVGDSGYVLGVDLQPIAPLNRENVQSVVADIQDPRSIDVIAALLPREPDVVLSDLSPNVSGIWELDHARQISLAESALDLAVRLLKRDGNFLVKVFQGEMLRQFRRKVRESFREVKATKPKASRARSSELYILAFGLLSRGPSA